MTTTNSLLNTELTVEVSGSDDRASEVLQEIQSIKSDLMSRSLQMGRLLREVRDSGYHLNYGFSRFDEWVEKGSGLDRGRRTAYYLIQIIEFQEKHGVTDADMLAVGLSKIKELATLPPETESATIANLVENAKELSYSDLKDVCGSIKNTEFVYKTLKLNRDFAEGQWVTTFELARKRYGDAMGGGDISDERCLEMIFAEFMAMPDEEEISDEDAYALLKRAVHERDGWQCRICKTRERLHAHHLVFKSQGGQDTMENLLTVCLDCHEKIHKHLIYLKPAIDREKFNANSSVFFTNSRFYSNDPLNMYESGLV